MAALRRFSWLSLKECLAYEAEAKAKGVSEVARSTRGFMRAYEAAKGNPDVMAGMIVPGIDRFSFWDKRRDEFLARHVAQYNKPGGRTRRRWLSLVMWAHKPPGPVPET